MLFLRSAASIAARPEASQQMTADAGQQEADSWPIAELREGRHYYMEGEYMVFTEAYHRARGRCCGSACRHCPFEHANVRRR